MKKTIDRIIQVLGVCFFAVAVWIIVREINKVGWGPLWKLIISTPLWLFGIVFILLICDYLVLSGYDVLALKYLKKKLPYPLIFKVSTLGFAIGNTVGHAYISGGALRYIFYLKHGLKRMNIMMLIAFETVMFCLGLMTTYVIAIALLPWTELNLDRFHLTVLYASGFFVLLGLALYGMCVLKFHKRMCICRTRLVTPTPKNTLSEIVVSCLDNLFLSLIFYILLRYHFDINFLNAFVLCVIAMTIGVCMQSPGGLGVFEGLVLLMLPHTESQTGAIIASLVLFRVMYFFIPFILSGLYLSVYWLLRKRKSSS